MSANRLSKQFTVLLLLGVLVGVPAQAQDLGYVDQRAVLVSMPGMQEVQKKIQTEMKQQQRQLQQRRQKFQKEVQQFQQQQSLLDDSARAERKRELQRQQRKLQQSTQKRQKQMQQRRREMMQPLLEKLQAAIDKVAAQQELDAVLRRQVLVYEDQTSDRIVDITRDVASELGISLNQTPGEPSPTLDQNATPPGNQTPPPGGGGQ
jgi:outer membrane protein